PLRRIREQDEGDDASYGVPRLRRVGPFLPDASRLPSSPSRRATGQSRGARGQRQRTRSILRIETRKGKDGKPAKEVDKGWTCDLIPNPLGVARYFAQEQAAINYLAADLENVTARLAELEEEHAGEDGAFADLDKVNRANVAARLRELKDDKE